MPLLGASAPASRCAFVREQDKNSPAWRGCKNGLHSARGFVDLHQPPVMKGHPLGIEIRTLYFGTMSPRTTILMTVLEIGWLGTAPSVQIEPPTTSVTPRTGVVPLYEPDRCRRMMDKQHTWYVTFEVPRTTRPQRRSPLATRTFSSETQAKIFARQKLDEGLVVSAGTIVPHSPRQILPSTSVPAWLDPEPDET